MTLERPLSVEASERPGCARRRRALVCDNVHLLIKKRVAYFMIAFHTSFVNGVPSLTQWTAVWMGLSFAWR